MSRKSSKRLALKDQIQSEEEARYFNELYEEQMEWTVSTRKQLYRKMNLFHARKILEVGSGTGAVLREIQSINSKANLVGIDWNLIALNYSRGESLRPKIIHGKGEILPFPSNSFDITLCHYFLMWVKEPLTILEEMIRVTRVGGWIACLAEPDYGGRIDYPASELWEELLLGSLSAHDPFIGRKLRSIFFQVGLKAEVGLQSTVLSPDIVNDLYELDIAKLGHFLLEKKKPKLAKLQQTLESRNSAEIFSFMPVFFGLARNLK
ncbi:MAG: class I SAM-dependent methyltransferase [Candidatus Hodarchaeales archaeon]|jgi:ubiquinone/menaquinone biosynthesis C-methylase UbiE